MNKKIAWIAAGIACIALAGGLIWAQTRAIRNAPVQTEAEERKQSDLQNREASAEEPVSSFIVTYASDGFSPRVLRVPAGEVVTFQNMSPRPMWPAASPHPTHTGYPMRGECSGSAFDSCAMVGSGQSWSFRFDVKGSWQYHNHLYPSFGGVIAVE
ncbi:MAG: hypothetical protein HYU05_00390 [Candidatus Wildermuthbacteria bacterium]|nr:hypothetical protein [Candidatus Wildermuthbacteria bacterium]